MLRELNTHSKLIRPFIDNDFKPKMIEREIFSKERFIDRIEVGNPGEICFSKREFGFVMSHLKLFVL